MTPITITGALTMLSNNGDGPQLLTDAAEFLNALAQMGVQMAVEINLRPVGAPPVDVVLRTPAQPQPAPVDPTPAAPAQPAAPQTLWRNLSREQRTALLHMEGRHLAKALGRAPTMTDWDAAKPGEYPTASGVAKYLEVGWTQLAAAWCTESA
jgi:hypothetical protein